MEALQAFLNKYDQIPPKEKSMALLLAEQRFLKIKQAVEEEQNQPENIQELLLKLINDLQILNGIQLKQEEQTAKVSSQYWKPPIFYDDDDEESSIPLRDIISKLPLVKDLNPIPSESEDTSKSDSDCDLSLCDDFSPINVYEEKSVTFSNPLFDSNDDFTSSDDESLSEEDDIESKDSYVSNLDEPALLVTPLSDDNEVECFDPGGDVDEIEFLLHNEWKKILYDAPIDDLMTEDKVFDPGISAFHFSSLEPATSHQSGTFMCFNVYPNIMEESPMEI
ncbi:hypothetical protein Tco_0033790 [Tanacetum coccineum]